MPQFCNNAEPSSAVSWNYYGLVRLIEMGPQSIIFGKALLHKRNDHESVSTL